MNGHKINAVFLHSGCDVMVTWY